MGEVLFPVLGFMVLIGSVTVAVILVRITTALVRRLEAVRFGVAPPYPVVGGLREELDTMQERLDFLERALLAQNQSGRGLPAGERQP